jgi:phenylpropionate dioxygenase-like ring-hydroxylating dioxygenase large terminal subunit
MLLVYLKEKLTGADLRRFSQSIFGQDKPILENQLPKRLPLGARAEMSMEFDSASIAYRRWLRSSGIRYGATFAGNS